MQTNYPAAEEQRLHTAPTRRGWLKRLSMLLGGTNFNQPTDMMIDAAGGLLHVADQHVGTGAIYHYKTDGSGRMTTVNVPPAPSSRCYYRTLLAQWPPPAADHSTPALTETALPPPASACRSCSWPTLFFASVRALCAASHRRTLFLASDPSFFA